MGLQDPRREWLLEQQEGLSRDEERRHPSLEHEERLRCECECRECREVQLELERCGLAWPGERRREVTWVEPC